SARAVSTLWGRSRSGASNRWARVASSVMAPPEARPRAPEQLLATPDQPRLRRGHRHPGQRCDLRDLVPESVVHEDRVRLLRLHRSEDVLQLFDLRPRLELLLERRVVLGREGWHRRVLAA